MHGGDGMFRVVVVEKDRHEAVARCLVDVAVGFADQVEEGGKVTLYQLAELLCWQLFAES